MPIFGIDVSEHNGAIDWGRVRAVSAIKFAIARAVICTKPDAQYSANDAGIRAAGLLPGAYHFLYPDGFVDVGAQADRFMATIGDATGRLVMLDVEPDGAQRPTARDARNWLARFRQRYPRHPVLIYAPRWYWQEIGNPAAWDLGPLVQSRYVNAAIVGGKDPGALWPSVPAAWTVADYGGWKTMSMLQFTENGRVPGIGGQVDFDAFLGTITALRTLAGIPTAAPGVVHYFSGQGEVPGVNGLVALRGEPRFRGSYRAKRDHAVHVLSEPRIPDAGFIVGLLDAGETLPFRVAQTILWRGSPVWHGDAAGKRWVAHELVEPIA